MDRELCRKVLEYLENDIHETSLEKGWWDEHTKLKTDLEYAHESGGETDPRFADELYIFARTMLMVTELSEGIEARRLQSPDDKLPSFDGLSVELADCIIRIFDTAARFRLPVIGALLEKIEYNKTRSYKHGGKLI